MNDEYKPKLIESGVKSFLGHTLKQCNKYKEKYYNVGINIFILLIIILSTILILFFRYKGKLTEEEKEEKERVKQQYIMSKIKNFQNEKLLAQQKLITGLPHWEN
jgi:hypothetical protein